MIGSLVLIALLAASPSPAPDSGADLIVPGELELYATQAGVGLELPYTGDANNNAKAEFIWRKRGDSHWRNGVDPTVDRKRKFIWASIWPLTPGDEIEVSMKVGDPESLGDPIVRRITLPLLAPAASHGTEYFVSPGSGSDRGVGSRESPFKTLGHAATVVAPGDTVLALSGIYAEGDLLRYLRGDPGKPIVFAAAPGEKPILDSSLEIPSSEWIRSSRGIFSTKVEGEPLFDPYLTQDGRRVFRYQQLGDLRKDPFRVGRAWAFDPEERTVYVRTGSGKHPSEHDYRFARHGNGFYLEGSRHLIVRGFEVRNFSQAGVRLSGPSVTGNVILENIIHNCGNGIFLKDPRIGGNAIWRNVIHEPGLSDYDWDPLKKAGSGGNGIALFYAGRGTSICHNRIYDWFDGIQVLSYGKPDGREFSRDTDIMYNQIWNIRDDALEIDGGGVNVRAHANRMRNVHSAISLAPVERGPVYVTRNEATFRSLMFKLSVGGHDSPGPVYAYHNAGYALVNDDSATMIRFNSLRPVVNKVFVNNAMIGSYWSVRYGEWGNWLNHNCYFHTSTVDAFRKFEWDDRTYGDFAAFQASTGQESGGIYADPQFTSTPDMASLPLHAQPDYLGIDIGDFRPRPGSPLVDRGAVVRGINEGFLGEAPDIGAHESR